MGWSVFMDWMDELINSWQLSRAFNEFWENKSDSINGIYDNIQNQIKDTFFTGYYAGYENGHFDGITDAKLKMMVKLAVHTNLNDDTILIVLEKENEEHFLKALSEIREKQKNQS